MPEIPIIKGKDFYKHLVRYGCIEVSIKGSHHKLHNPKASKTSIISIHSNKDIRKGSFASALNQLGIDIDDFLKFIGS